MLDLSSQLASYIRGGGEIVHMAMVEKGFLFIWRELSKVCSRRMWALIAGAAHRTS
jgi:hypothetical protein